MMVICYHIAVATYMQAETWSPCKYSKIIHLFFFFLDTMYRIKKLWGLSFKPVFSLGYTLSSPFFYSIEAHVHSWIHTDVFLSVLMSSIKTSCFAKKTKEKLWLPYTLEKSIFKFNEVAILIALILYKKCDPVLCFLMFALTLLKNN